MAVGSGPAANVKGTGIMALDAFGQPGNNEDAINNVSAHDVGDILRLVRLGDLMRGNLVQHVRAFSMVASGTGAQLATLLGARLPDKSKAAVILRATARAGSVTGELTPVAYGTTPATTQIAVAPNGDIVTLLTDAITSLDIVYIPERGLVLELTLPVVTNVATIPASYTANGIILLEEAEAVAAGATGSKIVLVPGAPAPAAGQARLNVAKTTVTFAGADAVTRARIKVLYGLPAAASLDGILSASPSII